MSLFEQRTVGDLNLVIWGKGHIPVLVFHGGPGSGLNHTHTSFFDEQRHRVVLFDQRGTGHSGKAGSLAANTTQHILQDAETIRVALDITDWVVFGSCWGAALALAYAGTYPERVRSLIARSAFVSCAEKERWILHERPNRFEAGKTARDLFLEPLDPAERQHPVAAWFARMTEGGAQAHEAARRVIALEAGFRGPKPGPVKLVSAISSADVVRSRIYLWYWLNSFFLPDGEPADPKALSRLPHRLIHGEEDLITPIEPALDYAQRGGLDLEIIPGAGNDRHATSMLAAVRRALADLGR